MLALLPTVREEIIGALPVEDITNELQRQRSEKMARSGGPSEAASSEYPSAPASTIDDSASMSSFQTGSYIHASQMADSQDGRSLLKKKSKAQLWNDMKISCESAQAWEGELLLTPSRSHHKSLDSTIHPLSPHAPDPHPAEPPRPPYLPVLGRLYGQSSGRH